MKSPYDNVQAQLGEKNYFTLLNNLASWRGAGGHNDVVGREFNRFDNPGTLYFRVFFDFQKGLLDCIHDYGTEYEDGAVDLDSKQNKYFWNKQVLVHNSALNYLVLNNEWERADMLRDFINLLSNISVNSPWYFMSLEGLGDVLDRGEFTSETFTLSEPKVLSIKCLPDAYDQRIATLLDLYRAICYSYKLHKEIIPANLRRFDMYVYIFPNMIRGIHTLHNRVEYGQLESSNPDTLYPIQGKFATFDQDRLSVDDTSGQLTLKGSDYLTSSKLIILRNCEIDLNASKSGYETVSNEEGFNSTYTIPIKVRYAEEQRYNEFLMKRIGDLVLGDMDLPGSNDETPGKDRQTWWGPDNARSHTTMNNIETSRVNSQELKTGRVWDSGNDSMESQKETDQLGKSLYRDEHKTTLADPWLDMGKQKLESVAGQVNQMVNAGKSAISSWVDVEQLNGSFVNATSSLVDRLMFGNIFHTNIQDITSNLTSTIAGVSSDRVIDQGMRGQGWRRSNANEGSISSFGENLNLRTSHQPSQVHQPVSGNIFTI